MNANSKSSTGVALLIKTLIVSIYCLNATGATITASSSSQTHVQDAYNSASEGDTIEIPAGASTWTSPITIAKSRLTIVGAGTNATIIQPNSGHALLRLYKAAGILSNVTVSGIRFEGNSKNTSNNGLLQIGNTGGTLACDNVYEVRDFRVCSNLFSNVGTNDLVGGLTGWPAVMASGYVYGVIDRNVFDNCYGECLDLGADGTGDNIADPVSLQRSLDYGGYTNGTIFVEDNTWNYTIPISAGNYGAENAFDGNSGSRWTIRYNTFNIASNTRVQALISNHETCAPRSCDGATQGDVGSLMMEIYGNTVNNSGTSPNFGVGTFVHQRGGRALIYSNIISGVDTGDATIVRLSNLRSYHRSIACSAPNGRGYSTWAHEFESGLTSEGVDVAKTTLAEPLDASETEIDLTSVTGFSADGLANGFSIRIGTEQIDYTGISGNTLTGCTRGANDTTAATHSNGANVDYLKFGNLLEQINNTYIWANTTVGSAAKNTAEIGGDFDAPDYSFYDIKSFADRPNNWQYREGSALAYTAYDYPHPLTGLSEEGGSGSDNAASVQGSFNASGSFTIQ